MNVPDKIKTLYAPERGELLKMIFTESGFGLEEECQRVDKDGHLSNFKHPFKDAQLDRDFCESQLEMITGVSRTPAGTVNEVGVLKKKALKILAEMNGGPEYLWPFSNPPVIEQEDDIHIAQFGGDRAGRTLYRNHLAGRYGKRKQALCGVHFNFSFPLKIIEIFRDEGKDPDTLYLKLAASLADLAWLIVALTAASPVYDSSCTEEGIPGKTVSGKYSSLRCSEEGYWNYFSPQISFSDIDSYIRSISTYVDSGELYSSSELYYPVRLKPKGPNSLAGLREGIDHIELRMIDVDPLVFEGVDIRDIKFITALIACITDKLLFGPGNDTGIYASDVKVQDVEVHDAEVHGTDVHDAEVHGTDVHDAEVHGVDARDAEGYDAEVHSADAHAAELHGAQAHGAEVRDTDVHDAETHDADACEHNTNGDKWSYYRILPEERTEHAVENMKAASGFPLEDICIKNGGKVIRLTDAALTVIDDVREYTVRSGGTEDMLSAIDHQREKILYPEKRYASIIKEEFENDYQGRGLELAKKYSGEA